MDLRFPLKDVDVRLVASARTVEFPLYADKYWQMNQREFAMQVEGVADYYAFDGREVEYCPGDGADRNSIELYLNGSVYGAILHQRKILPMHGSSFIYNGKGIMLCGEAGAGKSSLTASFCLQGADFLTDDVTPLLLKKGIPYIWALSDSMKLWDTTLLQLGRKHVDLKRIHPEMDKYYYPMNDAAGKYCRLDQVYVLEEKETKSVAFTELNGQSKFIALRKEIYRCEYIKGMPDNDKIYFQNILDICNTIKVFRVIRPKEIGIQDLRENLETRILANQGRER